MDKQIDCRKNENNKKKNFITYLRLISCLLIINSHCREIYPVSYLAIGGGFGNAFFFLISGYCLAMIKNPFLIWYKRRIKRLLPTTFLVLIIGALCVDGISGLNNVSFATLFTRYLDRYWFVWAILIYYCIFYRILRSQNLQKIKNTLLMYLAGYIFLYFLIFDNSFFVELEGFAPFKVYFYFGVFLTGGLIRLYDSNYNLAKLENQKYIYCFVFAIVSFCVWCTEYMMVMVFETGFLFQFLIHLSVYILTITIFVLAIRLEEKIFIPNGLIGKIIAFIADSTLEIYLVQVTFIPLILNFLFPINWFLFVGGSIFVGILLHYGWGMLEKKIVRGDK